MIPRYLKSRTVLVAALSLAALQPAQAQLFGDNEARRAILDLRERYQGMQQEMTGMRSSVQQMQGQIDTLQTELARSRGREEQLTRELNELQERHTDLAQLWQAHPQHAEVFDSVAL